MPETESKLAEPIALFDMDGTLADFDASMRFKLGELRAPGEDPQSDTTAFEDVPYIRARRRLIKAQPGFWRELAPIPLGFSPTYGSACKRSAPPRDTEVSMPPHQAMSDVIKYRQRQTFDAFRWTGDRVALRAWIASLPVPIKLHDCGSTGDYLAGPDVLFNWTTIEADPKDPLDQPERVFGNRIERGQWIVLQEMSTWVKGSTLVGIGYTDEEFRARFEEVIPLPRAMPQGSHSASSNSPEQR